MITVLGAWGLIQDVEVFVQQLGVFSAQEHLVIQAFDARVIYSKEHVISAVNHAKRAFAQKTNATNTLALEILLYAAGERQIQKAIKKTGVKKGKQRIVFVLTNKSYTSTKKKIDPAVIHRFSDLFQLSLDESVIKGNSATLKRFGITQKELSTLPEEKCGDLILEKVALVDIIK